MYKMMKYSADLFSSEYSRLRVFQANALIEINKVKE